MEPECLDWFKPEILVHEEALVRYLTRCWLRRRSPAGCLRPGARDSAQGPAARPEIRSFHYHASPHDRPISLVAIDAVGDLDTLNAIVEELSPEERTSAHQELRRLAAAIDCLPPQGWE